MPFEVVDHTADIGIRVWAGDLPTLLAESARGMFEQIADLEKVASDPIGTFCCAGIDETDLVINMLRELLHWHVGKGMLIKKAVVESLNGLALTGRAWGEHFDPARHTIRNEIKAVTYAGGDVRKTERSLEVSVIFDV